MKNAFLAMVILFIVSCYDKSDDSSKCIDGYLIMNSFTKEAFCKDYYTAGGSIVGKDCYRVGNLHPRVYVEKVIAKEAVVFNSKCFNVDTGNNYDPDGK